MRKQAIAALLPLVLLSGCAKEFNSVYKSQDFKYKYEYAKESFALGKYQRAATLLQDLIIPEKGSQDAQECLYMLGMAEYKNMDYETASETFKKYVKTYPRGDYAELAEYYAGQSLYMSTLGSDGDRQCHQCFSRVSRPLSRCQDEGGCAEQALRLAGQAGEERALFSGTLL